MIVFNSVAKFHTKILAHTDASYLNIDNKVRSVGGKVVFLSNQEESQISPLYWKGKTIQQVCKSTKDAETRAFDSCADDAWFLAKVVNEIMTGKKGRDHLEVVIKCDNQGVRDSLNTTKQVENKKLRPIVQSIKDMLTRKEINQVDWIPSADCHADILTKKGKGSTDSLMEVLQTGKNI